MLVSDHARIVALYNSDNSDLLKREGGVVGGKGPMCVTACSLAYPQAPPRCGPRTPRNPLGLPLAHKVSVEALSDGKP